jgi:D-3-phosphoglycerate dehydrogenase/C-terminal binding protein
MEILIQRKTDELDIELDILKGNYITSISSENDVANCDGLIVWHDITIDKYILDRMPDCKWIVRYGTGYDNINISECKKRSIKVSNTPDYGIEEVSNFTIALILLGTRDILKSIGSKGWILSKDNRRSSSLVLGIVGLGRIGTAVALKAKALGFNVTFYDPYIRSGFEKSLGINREYDLNQLLGRADVVSLHVPLNKETVNLINLDYAKDNSIIINTSRNGVLDKNMVHKNINRIKYVFTDVDDDISYHNVIKTPHIAFYTKESLIEMRSKACEEMLRMLNGHNQFWKVE